MFVLRFLGRAAALRTEILETAADDGHDQQTPVNELKRGAQAAEQPTKKAKHTKHDDERDKEKQKEKGNEKKVSKQQGDNDEKKKRNSIFREATALKERYLKAVAVQSTIERQVASDPSFEWAKNATQQQRFDLVKSGVETAIQVDNFNQYWLVNDLASAKKKFGINELDMLCGKFVGVKQAVDALETEQARFQKMHRANS